MPTRRFERIALAQLLVGGCAVVFCACVLIEHAHAQPGFVPQPPPPPPPVFNPSPPNTTVPQPSYKPISPETPSTVPGSEVTSPEVTSPVNEPLPRTAARSHRRTSVARTRSLHHRGRSIVAAPPYYRGRSIVAGPTPPYYYSPYAPYGCAWRRGWDGEWYRTSPCS
jgi:hypothetical protein